MAERKLYVGSGAEYADDGEILREFGYNPRDYYVKSKEDGPCGGGGDDSCYVVIESRHHARAMGEHIPDYYDEDEGWDGWSDD